MCVCVCVCVIERERKGAVRIGAGKGRRNRAKGNEGKERRETLSVGISTYDCPGGVHRSAKQSSPGSTPWL